MKTKEIRILKKFAYKVTDEVIKSLDGQTHPPLDSDPKEHNKKQINRIPNKPKQNNSVMIDANTKELMVTVPLRHKNAFYFSFLPDPITLFLNLAHQSLQRIIKLEEWLESEYKPGSVVIITNDNNFHQKKFGNVISCMVFAMMAVEALCNELLPEQTTISGREVKKKEMEEKWSLEEKFKLLKVEGALFEQKHLDPIYEIKSLRDSVVHFKSFSKDLNQVKNVYPFDKILNLDISANFDHVIELIKMISPDRVQFLDDEDEGT
jgi:hypothetical protein